MATSQKLTEHFLTCTVCTEVFRDPCSLACHHTFCRECVIKFTTENPEAVKAESIPCPTCRKFTKVADPAKPVEQWADDLKALFVIQGLLDDLGPGSKDSENCSYCRQNGETTPAVYWCPVCDDSLCVKCVEIHKKHPATRHHHVDEMTSEVKVRRKRKVACKEHQDEFLEFHCRDCEMALCQKCCITKHRSCKSVVEILAQMEEMKRILESRMKNLDDKQLFEEEQVERQKMEVARTVEIVTKIRSDIESTFEAIIKTVNEKKALLLEDLRQSSQQQLDESRSDIKTREMAVHMYKQERELLDQAGKSESEIEVFELYQTYRTETRDSYKHDTSTVKQGDITWKKNTALLEAVKELNFGQIRLSWERELDFTTTPVLEDTIQVRVPGDSSDPAAVDVISMDVDDISTVVVTDCNNTSVKSFYNRNNQPCHSKLTLGGQPWGLTIVKENQVAVTLPLSEQIAVVEVNPDLKLMSTIKTKKPYISLTSLTGARLAVGCGNPPSVDILDMSGNITKSITPQIHNKPCFISSTGAGGIVVSDVQSKSVVCVSQQGDVVFNYTGPGLQRGPAGVVCTGSGDILVADCDQHSILHLTKTGQFVRTFLTLSDCGEYGPVGLHVDTRGRMYVCMGGNGVVRVYRCVR